MNQTPPLIKIGSFSGYRINGKDAPIGIFKLRHDTFVKKLKWLPENSTGYERDSYDDFSTILYVVSNASGVVVGTIRVINSDHEFMLDKDFKPLVESSPEYEHSKDSAEISRFTVENVENRSKAVVIQMLFELLERWVLENKKKYLYFVTTNKYANELRFSYGISFSPIGKVSFTQSDVSFQTFKIDVAEITSIGNRIKRYLYLHFLRKFI